MKSKELNNFIKDIGKKAFGRLETLDIPPYPKYYQDSFNDFLEEHSTKEIKTVIKKNLYLIEPIKYIQSISLSEDCYNLAKETIEEFSKTNETIKKSSIDLSKITKEIEDLDNSKLFQSFDNFYKTLIKTLKEADNTISKLQEEILQLEKESNIDPLTKLFNKRALIKDLNILLDFGKNKDLDLCLILFDLDDFKKINDTYGHIAGDKTLIYISKVLKSSLRNDVKSYRFGGDEFIVLLNRIKISEAQKIAQRIINIIADSKLIYKNQAIELTMSGGIASHKANDTFETFIERADKALYEAKETGKNKVMVK